MSSLLPRTRMHGCGTHVLCPACTDHDYAPTPLRSRIQYEGFKPPYNVSRVQPFLVMAEGEMAEQHIATSCTMIDCRTSLADANVCHRARESWEGRGGELGMGGEGWSDEGWSGEGWSVEARHQPQPLPPQKALQTLQSIYAEGSEYNSFECQTYPPGISAFAEIAANALKEEEMIDAGIAGSIYWSTYTARLCRRRVETCHIAVRARAKGASPPTKCRGTRLLLDPSRRQLTSPPCACLSARWPLSLLIASAVGITALNILCYAGCLLLCCREWWCQNPKLKRFQYF